MRVDRQKNYLARIEASVGSEMFQHLYITDETGSSRDVAEGGELSCAIHVSSVMALAGLIDHPHATVTTTLATLMAEGWEETSEPVPGAVIHWLESKDGHEHIGFWISPGKVISNSVKEHVPVIHTETLYDGRAPVAYYINKEILPK